MRQQIIFRSDTEVDLVFTLDLDLIQKALSSTKQKLEGRGQRGRPRALNAAQIAEIVALLNEGKMTGREIATRFGVPANTITRIKNGVYVKNLDKIVI